MNPLPPWSIRRDRAAADLACEAMAREALSWLRPGPATPAGREALVLSLLDHPGAVALRESDGPGRACLVLRQVSGITLGDLIHRSAAAPHDALPAGEAVRILLHVCDAVGHAHALGIVHRGIAPQRILVGVHGEVALAGWGAAQLPGEQAAAAADADPAYAAPELAAGAAADARSDIFALGATLLRALDRSAPTALGAIARQAMAPDPAQRYADAAALRADLVRFQEGRPVLAQRQILPLRAARGLWRIRRRLALATVLLMCFGLVLGLLLWEFSRSVSFWGAPRITERFPDATWKQRWLSDPVDGWRQEGDRVVSTSQGHALLILPQRLHPPLAVEYEGEIQPGTLPCDLSCIWWEGPALERGVRPPIYFDGSTPACWVQFGAQDDQFSAIFRRPGNPQVAFSPRKLEIGRRYRMRVEFENDAVRAFVDGELWMEHKQLFPVRSGFLALYAYYPGKAFGDIRIWCKGVPERLPVLAAGDAAYMYGQWRLAADEWGRVGDAFAGSGTAADAALRIGMAELKLGERAGAELSWKQLTGERADIAATMLVEDSWERHDGDGFAAAFTRLWREKPAQRDRLATIWSTCLGRIPGDRPARSDGQLRLLLRLRDELFPDHAATACDVAELKIYAGRATEVAAVRDYPRSRAFALLALGRNREVLREPVPFPATDYLANLALGEVDAILASPWRTMAPCGRVLAKADRGEEALALRDDPPLMQVLLGDPAAILDKPGQWPGNANAAAIQCGRLEQAAGPAAAWAVGGSWIAQVLLRREDQPVEAFHGTLVQLQQARWLRALEEGGAPEPALAQAVASAVIDHRHWGGWFVPWFAQPFVEGRLAGEEGRARLDRLAEDTAETLALRPHFLARLLAGRIARTAFLAQPIRAEAEAWWLLGSAMRAELDGDLVAALAAYHSFRALPMQRRLLERQDPDPMVERFVAWRVMELERDR